MKWYFKGGAGVQWAEEQRFCAMGNSVVILMIGGNDIANGMSPMQLADRLTHLAYEMIDIGTQCPHGQLPAAVAICSLWPRSDSVYNAKARQFAAIMERRLHGNSQVTYWLWDYRQPFHNCDGVHLTKHGYTQAIKYLVAVIVWFIHLIERQ